jgi:apolipoprotein D and lipocalin family protein
MTDLKPVPRVDLPRFMGRWYVIAHIPYSLERGKVATYDEYTLRPDGRIDNVFGFRKGSFDAPEQTWRGIAWVVDPVTNAEWRVQFLWPLRAAYVVTDLDPAYRWAVVGHPSRRYLWVLARDRALPEKQYQALLARAATQGFDTGAVRKVPQPPER